MKFKFSVGEKVLCFEPDESKARVLYNAKIMDADMLKDSKGKKHIEYKIHFQGWNHAWDRWADESFVLKDDEQNRKLQRKLARKAIKKLRLQKGRKRHHLPGVASKQEGGEMMEEDDYSSDESAASNLSCSTAGISQREKQEDCEDHHIHSKKLALSAGGKPYFSQIVGEDGSSVVGLREELPPRRLVTLDIPISLRLRIEEDFAMIKKRDMLVKLPICPNVVQILDNYVKKFAQQYVNMTEKQKFTVPVAGQQGDPDLLIPPEKRLNLCQEVCSDIKLLFDYALPLTLLYLPERHQLKHLLKNTRFCKQDNTKHNENSWPENNEKNFETVPPEVESAHLENIEEAADKECNKINNQLSSTELDLTSVPQTSAKPQTKKKNAEAQLIEETHKYLIPNQPNLDQTGLSKDAQGRRRSSRLSHHEAVHSPPGFKHVSPMSPSSSTSCVRKDSKYTGNSVHEVSVQPFIFLRALSRRPSCSGVNECTTAPVGVPHQSLYNASPRIDRESYISSSGSDVKAIKELKKVWDWSILPSNFEPEEGAIIPPSMLYGVHHLLRFFVKLPDILVSMEIPEFKVRVIMKHLHSLLKFLSEYERELFEVDNYAPL